MCHRVSLAVAHRPKSEQTSIVTACGLSSCGSRLLEHRFSSCSIQAQLLHSMWDLPGSGIKPMSPALAVDSYLLHHQRSPGIILFLEWSLINKNSLKV